MKRLVALLLAAALLAAGTAMAQEDGPAEDFLRWMLAGDENETLYAAFSDEMKAAVPYETFEGLNGQITALGGAFLGVTTSSAQAYSAEETMYVLLMDMEQRDLAFTLLMKADGTVTGLSVSLPQTAAETPAPAELALPQGVTETDVTVGEEPYLLGGKLTMPDAGGSLPAVVLVHGSGPNDMDETVGATKLFRDIAYALSQRGIAVLRYEKRTKTYGAQIASGADYAAFTVEEETIQDALSAVTLLQATDRIDPTRVYVLGHSLGAMLTPRIAKEAEGRVAGMILLNGTPKEFWQIMLRQNRDAVAALPADQQAVYTAQLDAVEEACAAFPALSQEDALSTSLFGLPAWYLAEMVQQGSAADILAELALPALILNGTRDFQVTQEEGRLAWEAVLDMDSPWLHTLWPEVNHLMMAPEVSAEAAGTTEEYDVPCTADAACLSAIGDFILKTEEK